MPLDDQARGGDFGQALDALALKAIFANTLLAGRLYSFETSENSVRTIIRIIGCGGF